MRGIEIIGERFAEERVSDTAVIYGGIFGSYWNGIYAVVPEGKHTNSHINGSDPLDE